MTDISLQLDAALTARLQAAARARSCTLEQLITQLLEELLAPDAAAAAAPDAIGALATHWNQEEKAFLKDAAQAFNEIPADEAVTSTDRTEWDKPLR